jgi:hypothetical protein
MPMRVKTAVAKPCRMHFMTCECLGSKNLGVPEIWAQLADLHPLQLPVQRCGPIVVKLIDNSAF